MAPAQVVDDVDGMTGAHLPRNSRLTHIANHLFAVDMDQDEANDQEEKLINEGQQLIRVRSKGTTDRHRRVQDMEEEQPLPL